MFTPWWHTFWFTILILFPVNNLADCPNGVKVRKSWRSLDIATRKSCSMAIARFIKLQPVKFSEFGDIHSKYAMSGIHGSGHFLPWHRYFVTEFEKSVLTYGGDPNYVQHYWDASRFGQEALKDSPIFDRVTGLGLLTPDCISFGDLEIIKDSGGECVTRSRGFGIIDSSSSVHNTLDKREDFDALTGTLEGGYHGQVHGTIGGNMQTTASPTDPIFFFHHAQVDRFWSLWQSKNFKVRLSDFASQSPIVGFRYLERLEAKLINYPGVTVSSVMDISKLCYSYDDVPVNPDSTPPSNNVPAIPPSPKKAPSPPAAGSSDYLVLPGLPDGIALNTALMDFSRVRFFSGSTAVVVKNSLPELQAYFVSIPKLPPHPDWCLITPGLPSGKCIDIRKLSKEDADWWSMACFDYVEEYWSVISSSVVAIPSSLNRRSLHARDVRTEAKSLVERRDVLSTSRQNNNTRGGGNCLIDLGEICLLKYSTPIPDFWISMNLLNSTLIRSDESENRALVDKLNNLEGLIPESALANQPEVIEKRIIEALAGPECKISCLAKGIKVEVAFEKDARTTAKKLCELAKTAGKKGSDKPTHEELAKLIGVPLLSPNSVNNPFHQSTSVTDDDDY